ncbi:MAG: IPT/TIG domain-containing protein [Candidatus Magnetomorum sp.]|nr:IPT/TIG domain-containing protein [Candidatus Magnetomorum sp.]
MKMLRYLFPVYVMIFIVMQCIGDTVWADGPLMMFSFEEQDFEIGKNFDADIRLTQSDQPLSSYSYTLLFDQQVLKIITIEGGIHGNISNANSTGSINITQYASTWQILDECLLLTRITFQVIGDYCSVSELTLNQVTLYDQDIKPIHAQTTNSGINVICPKAKLIGSPQGTIHDNFAQIQVSGTGITHYKYSLDNSDFSDEFSTDSPISLYNLSEGSHCIKVLGKITSVWQTEQESTKACWFIYMPRPHVQDISPVYGSENGGTAIHIQGLYFHSDCRVFLGDMEANVLTVSTTAITCLSPPHSSKTVSITLKNPYDKTTSLNRAFTYYPEGSLYQMIYSEKSDLRIAPGAGIEWMVDYTTTDQNSYLPGIGIRLHYNSSMLNWQGFKNVYDHGMLSGYDLVPKSDDANLDNDPNTDKCIQIAWMDVSRNWSGIQVPHALFTMAFSTREDVDVNSESAVHFTTTSHATTHQFFAPSISINFQPWALDCTAQGSGHISPSEMISVAHNASQTVQFIPDLHHHIESVFIDGEPVGNISEYTFDTVTSDHLITVIFTIDRVTLTIEKAGSGTGMVKPMEGTYEYDYDTGVLLTTIASESSVFTGWSGDASGNGDISIIMDRDKHIFANFDIKRFTIVPGSGEHGTLSPAGPVIIDYNDSIIFKVLADRCYEVDRVWINGSDRGSILTHNFINVRADQQIEASFIVKDKDSDGLPDCMETVTGCTDVNVPDSDNDLLLDGEEDRNQNGYVDIGETSPCEPDSDSDGMDDGWELAYGLNPLNDDAMGDKDADGYANYFEYISNQNPEEKNQPYQVYYTSETDDRQPYQIITLRPDQLKIVPGGHFDLEVIYNATDNDPHATGIGFSIFFASGDIMWESFQSVLSNANQLSSYSIENDDMDLDNDAKTDQYVNLLWKDDNSQWPDTVLPQKICAATFSVNSNMPEGYSGYIHLQPSFLDPKYHFFAKSARYQAQRGNLDIDGNGIEDALTDGLLIMGYLYGFRNLPLIDHAIGPYAVRTTAEHIEPVLENMYPLFDIDGNGAVNALADGLLLVRYLFGFRGYELIYNLNVPDCTRCNSADIIEYIRQIKPD